ncbi:Ig-like domain-containing protein [Mycolicibacterium sp. CR10]|uniref:Ig-like domain-containing protein n=1 Tax=Mycolicibacterium sp. CR10 TaxID=2562314 RepID=UPI00148587A8|nr:Ig-like domain-containing protein [Mycolicibacterium sp. CR10]
MGTVKNTSRIGGLTLALGLGVAVTTGYGVAGAEPTDTARGDADFSAESTVSAASPSEDGDDPGPAASINDSGDEPDEDVAADPADPPEDAAAEVDQGAESGEAIDAAEDTDAGPTPEPEPQPVTETDDVDDTRSTADRDSSAQSETGQAPPIVDAPVVPDAPLGEAGEAQALPLTAVEANSSDLVVAQRISQPDTVSILETAGPDTVAAAVPGRPPVATEPVGLFTGFLALFGLKPGPVGSPVTPWSRIVEFIWVATRRLEYTLFNFSPRATETTYTVAPGTGFVSGIVGAIDRDPEDSLKYTVLTAPESGELELNPDGSFTYTPDPTKGAPQTVRFAVRVDEVAAYPHLHLLSLWRPAVTVDVELTINRVNSAPSLAVEDTEPGSDGSITYTVVSADPEGDAVVVEVSYDAAVGTITKIEDAVYRWTPDPAYAHELTEPEEVLVTFTAVDEFGAEAEPVTRSVVVEPQNSTPIVTVAAPGLDANGYASITVQYTDADGDDVRVLAGAAQYGSYVKVTVVDATGALVDVVQTPTTLDFVLRQGDKAIVVYQAAPGDAAVTEVIAFAADDGHGGTASASAGIAIPALDTRNILRFPGWTGGSVLLDSADSDRIYVVSGRTLYVVETATGATVAARDLGASGASVAVSPDGHYAYVARFSANVVPVYKVDLVAGGITEIGGARQAGSMAVSPDGTKLYVIGNQASEVYVIDTVTGAFSTPFFAGYQSFGAPSVAVSADGKSLYVGMLTNDLAIITLATGASTSVDLGATPQGSSPTQSIAVDGQWVYVTDAVNDTLVIVDSTTKSVAATIDVGGRPTAVAASPDREFVFVANTGTRTVSVIRPGAEAVTLTLEFSDNLRDVDVSRDGESLFVTTSAGVEIIAMDDVRALEEEAGGISA